MKKLQRISRLPLDSPAYERHSKERFEFLIGGGHPDERTDKEWLKMMKGKGYKEIDKIRKRDAF